MFTRRQLPSMAARQFARLHNLRYYVGERCKYGHVLKYTTSGNCVECAKQKSFVQYYAEKIIPT